MSGVLEPPRQADTAEQPTTDTKIEVNENAATQDASTTTKSFGVTTAEESENGYLKGWRLYITTLGMMICLYLVNIEVTIVSTSLITIANGFHSFNRTSWIVTGYLITYTGFIILWSKLSDIIGRKAAILATMTMFITFSGACGASQSMAQLITFRAFQGIGSAGAYSISILLIYEIVPRSGLPVMAAVTALFTALGFATGPLIGGVLAKHSIWRWIFYINLPLGGLAIGLLFVALPSTVGGPRQRLEWSSLRRIDIVGALILLTATLPLITALNEVYVEFKWSEARTIVLLVLAGVAWFAFFAWEYTITREKNIPEPIFPSRFLRSVGWMGMLLTSFFIGMPSTMLIIMLPQRFQIVNETSALEAGVRLLAFSVSSATAGGLSSILTRARIPFVYSLLLAAVFHTVGVTTLSTLPETNHYPVAGYVYQGLAGTGVGMAWGILLLATPFVVEPRDLAVATGAIIQFRFLGGAIGLAIGSNVLNGMLKSHLAYILSPDQLEALLHNTAFIETLAEPQRRIVQGVFAHAYTIQFRIMIGITAALFPAALLVWRKRRQLTSAE